MMPVLILIRGCARNKSRKARESTGERGKTPAREIQRLHVGRIVGDAWTDERIERLGQGCVMFTRFGIDATDAVTEGDLPEELAVGQCAWPIAGLVEHEILPRGGAAGTGPVDVPG